MILSVLVCLLQRAHPLRHGFFHPERVLRQLQFNISIGDMYYTGDCTLLAQVLTGVDL